MGIAASEEMVACLTFTYSAFAYSTYVPVERKREGERERDENCLRNCVGWEG